MVRFGVITDIHHSNMPDTDKLLHSAALDRAALFVMAMNSKSADFIIELGDMVDTVAGNKDPLFNLHEIEGTLTQFNGPIYHVLGNHDFDGLCRSDFLSRLTNTAVPQGTTYYSFNHNGLHCIVLDADYTVAEPHLPFDRQTADNPFWGWQDAWVPREQLEWLGSDLATTHLPTVIFTHQLLHRDNYEDHTIKNADTVRALMEASGKVIAVFSGHDHHGDYALLNGIHYHVLKSATAVNTDNTWELRADRAELEKYSPFSFIEISLSRIVESEYIKTIVLSIVGNGPRRTFECRIQTPRF